MYFKLGAFIVISALNSSAILANPTDAKSCICDAAEKLVCGSDGKTYLNKCTLDCAALRSGTQISVDHNGHCQAYSVSGCQCSKDTSQPAVCGSDGKTYQNECMLECQKRSDPTLRVIAYSSCVLRNPACSCPQTLKPVCGSNGETYTNACILNCIANDNFLLKFAHDGPCA